jgi:hypothetical protein
MFYVPGELLIRCILKRFYHLILKGSHKQLLVN